MKQVKMKLVIKNWLFPLIVALVLMFTFKPMVTFFPIWFQETYQEMYIPNSKVNSSTDKNITNRIGSVINKSGSKTTIQSINPTKNGSIGDTFGGTLGPVIALLAAFLTFLAFWIQYRANKQQESYIKQQRFEDTFFRLLDHYKKIVDAIDIRNMETRQVLAMGNECFREMYLDIEQHPDIAKGKKTEDLNIYDLVQNKYKHDLHHYYRFVYHTLKFIKHADIPDHEKFRYTSIFRASLSAYELIMIFYNGLHAHGKEYFKPLLEEFTMLKNLDQSLIINQSLKEDYHKLAFTGSKEREDLLQEWKKTQK